MRSKDTLIQSPYTMSVALELGFITHTQAEAVIARQKQLRQGNVNVSTTYIMLERQFLTLNQIRTVNDELEVRGVTAPGASACYTAVTTPVAMPGLVSATPRIGKFQTIKSYSQNGYTRVYKAVDTENGRTVVLKILPSGLSRNSQWVERFRREMRLAATIDHPNIVAVHECGHMDDSPYIAFEYVDGISLSHRLEREGNLSETCTWLVCRELAKGLAFIEEYGILHRDLKPDNVLLGFNGRIKIIDLGLSRSMLENVAITVSGQTVGTPFYMSPEQAHGTKGLDPRTDIYSLGCMAFHMLTGSVPFFAEDAVEVMRRHIQSDRPDPKSIISDLSPQSSRLVKWMMAQNLEDRPASAKVMVDEIGKLLCVLPERFSSTRPILHIAPS